MRKVVVLGSNSFHGQDFIDLLLDEPDVQVVGISRSPEKPAFFLAYRRRPNLSHFRFERFDLNQDMDRLLDFLDCERPDTVVDFVAQSEVAPSWQFPEHWYQTNTVALARLVNHLRQQSYLERFLYISSPEAYGSCTGVVTEDHPDNPSTPYAASRAAGDMLLNVYCRQYDFPAVTVRATNVYGARQQIFKIIPRTIIYLRQGRKVQLHGGGQAIKSYIHIRDVSRAEIAVLKGGVIGRRYHISPAQGVQVRQVVRTIARSMGKDLDDVAETVAERPGQDAAYVIDSSRIRNEFGWEPRISLEEGIAEVVDWVDDNWNAVLEQPLEYQHRP